MKKLLFLLLCLFLTASAAVSAQAAGRLNFMLTNLTGVDIVDVRISPTYYPNYVSDNLLNTNLDPQTRIYIGPNFYGSEKYWNITLQWANGYKHTWTHNQITRYNSYMVYANDYGVRMRQGYERSYARYDHGPKPALFAGTDPRVAVYVGTPEKVNAPAATKPYEVAANTRRATRDLVFDEEEEKAERPAVQGTDSSAVQGEKIAVKTTVELTRDGKQTTVLPTSDFKSGDKVRLLFSASRDGHVYWVAKGTSGSYQMLFPNEKAGMDNKVVKNKEYTVPSKGAWRFDDKKGTETVVCILAPNNVAELDTAVQLTSAGKKDEASSIIAQVVGGHETKRTTRDLVFEEEDEKDVNTKTQVSKDNEPFVATYELMHN